MVAECFDGSGDDDHQEHGGDGADGEPADGEEGAAEGVVSARRQVVRAVRRGRIRTGRMLRKVADRWDPMGSHRVLSMRDRMADSERRLAETDAALDGMLRDLAETVSKTLDMPNPYPGLRDPSLSRILPDARRGRCPYPRCISRRGHRGGHVLADEPLGRP